MASHLLMGLNYLWVFHPVSLPTSLHSSASAMIGCLRNQILHSRLQQAFFALFDKCLQFAANIGGDKHSLQSEGQMWFLRHLTQIARVGSNEANALYCTTNLAFLPPASYFGGSTQSPLWLSHTGLWWGSTMPFKVLRWLDWAGFLNVNCILTVLDVTHILIISGSWLTVRGTWKEEYPTAIVQTDQESGRKQQEKANICS